MTMNVGTDLKSIHDQIYGPDEPENIFGGGNAGIALAGHYLAQAFIQVSENNQRTTIDSLTAKVELLSSELTQAKATLAAAEFRNMELHNYAQSLNARQPAVEQVKQLLFHLNTLLFELSDTPPGSPLHAAVQNVTVVKNEVKV